MRLKVFLVVGARPNFMKIAPMHARMLEHRDHFEPVIVHTGQHYDDNMSQIFFQQLGLPRPDIYLGVGSGSQVQQTSEIMRLFEPQLIEHKPHVVFVVGDVTSTIACALTTIKTRIPNPELRMLWQQYEEYLDRQQDMSGVTQSHALQCHSHDTPLVAHIESGERSFDFSMPEEINRIGTDVLSHLLFTTSENANKNLIREGLDPRKIFMTGNIMIDSLLRFLPEAEKSGILHDINSKLPDAMNRISDHDFALVTLHRPGNVDDPETLQGILSALIELSSDLPIIFPMHPRTRKLVSGLSGEFNDRLAGSQVLVMDPVGYLDFVKLQSLARLVLTDSGGVQVETTYMGIPCLTLRPNTEWTITVEQGSNHLVSPVRDKILAAARETLKAKSQNPPEIHNWDGLTAQRIIDCFLEVLKLNT